MVRGMKSLYKFYSREVLLKIFKKKTPYERAIKNQQVILNRRIKSFKEECEVKLESLVSHGFTSGNIYMYSENPSDPSEEVYIPALAALNTKYLNRVFFKADRYFNISSYLCVSITLLE